MLTIMYILIHLLSKIIKLYQDMFFDLLKRNEDSNCVTIDELEYKFNKLYHDRHILDESLGSSMITLLNEKAIIKEFREKYKKEGISFKTVHKKKITIQTERLLLTYERTYLVPRPSENAQKLMDLNKTRGFFPLDIALGVSELPFKMTVKAMLKVAKVAQFSRSYKEANKTLAVDHGIQLDPVTIMNVTNHIGELAFNYEMEKAEECYNTLVTGNFKESKIKKEGILYIEMDGAFVRTREKSDKTNSKYRENKLGLVFSSDHKRIVKKRKIDNSRKRLILNGLERERYVITSKLYTSYVGSVDVFKKLIFYAAVRGGYGEYKETVIISDGAEWIKGVQDELFYGSQHILDFYHLCEKVWTFGRLFFKINLTNNRHSSAQNQEVNTDQPNYVKYREWSDAICKKLLDSNTNEALSDIIAKEDKLKLNKGKLSTYIIANKNLVDYSAYLEKKYDIGSGAIESGNKSILQRRLDGQGMHWHVKSAQGVVSLRAKMESDKWYSDVVVPVLKHYNIQ